MADPPSLFTVVQGTTALVLSGLAFGWSVVSWRANRAAEKEKAQRDSEKRDDELLAWSSEGIDVMARIEALAEYDPVIWTKAGFDQRRAELGATASALLDRGRIFFPNREGYRPRILDELKVACLVCGDLSFDTPWRNRQRVEELWQARGRFVADLREAVQERKQRNVKAAEIGRTVALADLPSERTLATRRKAVDRLRPLSRGRRDPIREARSHPPSPPAT